MTRVLSAYTAHGVIDPAAVAVAGALIREGKLVAIPTETVYGLGANALDTSAVRRVFQAKGRPAFNPLIVHVLDASQARSLADHWPEVANRLTDAFWPGPLSIVVRKAPEIPTEVTGGFPAVALRAPSHPVARAVIAAADVPIAAPSANRSTAVSPTTAAHVLKGLEGRIDAVLDAGPCIVGIESTVIDVTNEPTILRPGGISAAAIEQVIGPVRYASSSLDQGTRPSPGMMTRHYAPDADTLLVEPGSIQPALGALSQSARVGVIVREAERPRDQRIVAWEMLGDDPVVFGREMYAALHRIEVARPTHVLIERVPSDRAWEAIADRITRAAGKRE